MNREHELIVFYDHPEGWLLHGWGLKTEFSQNVIETSFLFFFYCFNATLLQLLWRGREAKWLLIVKVAPCLRIMKFSSHFLLITRNEFVSRAYTVWSLQFPLGTHNIETNIQDSISHCFWSYQTISYHLHHLLVLAWVCDQRVMWVTDHIQMTSFNGLYRLLPWQFPLSDDGVYHLIWC